MPEDTTPVDSAVTPDVPETAPGSERNWEADYQKLQDENRAYREKYQPYERLYSQNSEIQQFHEIAQAYADGNVDEVREWLIANAAQAQGLSVEAYLAKFDEPDEEDRSLTKKEVQAMLQEERQAAKDAQLQSQIGEVRAHAENLGYDPDTWQYDALLALAMKKYGNDLDAAHEELSKLGNEEEIIAKYVEGRRTSTRNAPRSPNNGGQAPSTERPIVSWADAEKGAEEYLRANI